LLLLIAVLVVLALIAWFGYSWTQRQYYVGVGDNGEVAVYRGVEQSVLGYELSEIDRTYDLAVTALPDFRRESVENGIPASDLADAERIVSDLQADADECSGESPDAEDCAGVDPTTAPADPSEEPTAAETTQPSEQPQQQPTRRPERNRGNAP
jgi:protein phosphatase